MTTSRERATMRLTTWSLLILALSALVTACSSGQLSPQFRGIEVTLETEADRTIVGELIAVRDGGIVYAENREVLRFTTFSDDIEVTAESLAHRIRFDGTPDEGEDRRLRMLSRYPRGLDDDRLAGMLAAFGQSELVRWP